MAPSSGEIERQRRGPGLHGQTIGAMNSGFTKPGIPESGTASTWYHPRYFELQAPHQSSRCQETPVTIRAPSGSRI